MNNKQRPGVVEDNTYEVNAGSAEPVAYFFGVDIYGQPVKTLSQAEAEAQASLGKKVMTLYAHPPAAASIPADFFTHKVSWRKALERVTELEQDECAKDYWRHELRAFDRAYGELTAPPQTAPVDSDWRSHVEQRIKAWRRRTMNDDGDIDILAIDDYMPIDEVDDLIDFVCDEQATPAPQPASVGLNNL